MYHGISPTVTNSTQQGASNVAPLGEASQIPRDRFKLRTVFPSTITKQWACSPFRVAMNAGDLYSRQYTPGGANQIKGSVGVGRYRNTLGSADGVQVGNGASGNQHRVYDSSDYTTYLKLVAKNRNYDDFSFGGANNGAYVPLMAIRRG
jgi:hypothetical protein